MKFLTNKNNYVHLWQAQLEKEAMESARYREQLEQERRDHELALRLAQETNDQLEEMSPQESRRYMQTLCVM
jgi:myosin-6